MKPQSRTGTDPVFAMLRSKKRFAVNVLPVRTLSSVLAANPYLSGSI
jgi:hypothetical protein